jgi:hypothetical protein
MMPGNTQNAEKDLPTEDKDWIVGLMQKLECTLYSGIYNERFCKFIEQVMDKVFRYICEIVNFSKFFLLSSTFQQTSM